MSTVNVVKTTFGLGSSDSDLIKSLFAPNQMNGYNPAAVMNKALEGTVRGNPDFPAGFNIDYEASPAITDFVPNIESPGVGNTVPQSDINSSDDLANKPSALRDMEKASVGKNGSVTSPATTAQTIGAHLIKDPGAN